MSYTISYVLNGGNVSGNPTNYTADTLPITLKNPTRSGYTFTGWTGSNGNTPQKIVTIEKDSTGNLNYTANWKQNSASEEDTPKTIYTISYVLNGGNVSGNPTSYTVDTLPITLKNPTRSGYTFTGWTGSNGNTPQTTVTISKRTTGNLSYTANWKQNSASEEDTPKTTYTITYALNGGNVLGNPASYTEDVLPITLKNPTQSGYTFVGWTGSNGGIPQKSVTIVKGSTGNKAYTANWSKNGMTPQPSATPTATPKITPKPTKKPSNSVKPTKKPSSVKVGKKVIVKNRKYKVTSAGSKREVQFLGVKKKTKNIAIPASIKISGKSYQVTSIAANALYKNKKVKKLTIGKNVKKIGKNAFRNCKKLRRINIKTKKLTLKTIGKNAFKGLSRSIRIYVPKSKLKLYRRIIGARGLQ